MHELLPALAGGVLIGSAAALLYGLTGRIAGISGIAFGLDAPAPDRGWRLAFLGGLIGGGAIAVAAGAPLPTPSPASLPLLLVAGLLVGVGTRLGNGCTSGHGVCGLARLSRRSLVAVLVFMGTGALVATARHWMAA